MMSTGQCTSTALTTLLIGALFTSAWPVCDATPPTPSLPSGLQLPDGCRLSTNPGTTLTCVGRLSPHHTPWQMSVDNDRVRRVTQVYIFGTPWATAPLLSNVTRLQSLTLYFNRQLTSIPVTTFANLPALKILRLTTNAISSVTVGTFLGLRRLKALDLSSNHLQSLQGGVFGQLPRLRYLHLEKNYLTSLPRQLLSGLPQLQHIDLSSNSIAQVPSGLFRSNPRLVRVILSGNRLTFLPPGLLTPLTASSAVSVDLRENRLGFAPAGVFSSLRASHAAVARQHNVYLYGNPLRCDCANAWAVQHDRHAPYVTCTSRNGSSLPVAAAHAIQNCSCEADADTSNGVKSFADGVHALPGCVENVVSLVGKPLQSNECPETSSASRQPPYVVSHRNIMIGTHGSTLVFQYERHFGADRVLSSRRQYIILNGHHDRLVYFAIAVSHRQLEVSLWLRRHRAVTTVHTTDACGQSLAGEKTAVLVIRPTPTGHQWKVSLTLNNISCRLSSSQIGEPVLVDLAHAPTQPSRPHWTGNDRVDDMPVTVGGSLLSDNNTVSSCFAGVLRRLDLYDTVIDSATLSVILRTGQQGRKSPRSGQTWCMSPLLYPDTKGRQCSKDGPVVATMACSELDGSGAKRVGAYRCTRTDECSSGNYHDNTCSETGELLSLQSAPTACPCVNGGSCRNATNASTAAKLATAVSVASAQLDTACVCPSGFAGSLCETKVCLNCSIGPCKMGWTGDRCDHDVDECAMTSPCRNLGTCINLPGGFLCECVSGYQGETCEQHVPQCQTASCQSGESCRELLDSHECVCASADSSGCGFNATNGSTCDSGLTCHFGNSLCVGAMLVPDSHGNVGSVATPICSCRPGYIGERCQRDVDECVSAATSSSEQDSHACNALTSTCVNTVGSYVCECSGESSSTATQPPTHTTVAATRQESPLVSSQQGITSSNSSSSGTESCPPPRCPQGCGEGGRCALPGLCECGAGYAGTACSVSLCSIQCPPGALCSGIDTCSDVVKTVPTTTMATTNATTMAALTMPTADTAKTTTFESTNGSKSSTQSLSTIATESAFSGTQSPSMPGKLQTLPPQPEVSTPMSSAAGSTETVTAASKSVYVPSSDQKHNSINIGAAGTTASMATAGTAPGTDHAADGVATTADAEKAAEAAEAKKRKSLVLVSGILGGLLALLFLLALVSVRQRRLQDRKREEDYLAAHAAMMGTRTLTGGGGGGGGKRGSGQGRNGAAIGNGNGVGSHGDSPQFDRLNMTTPQSDTTFTNSIHSDSLKPQSFLAAIPNNAGRSQQNHGNGINQSSAVPGSMPPLPRQDSNCLILVHQSYSMKADVSETNRQGIPLGSVPQQTGFLSGGTNNRLSGPSEAFTSFDPDGPLTGGAAEIELSNTAAGTFAEAAASGGGGGGGGGRRGRCGSGSFPRSVSQQAALSQHTHHTGGHGGVASTTPSTQASMAWDNLEGLVELCNDGPEYEI
eukprot:scpid24074/ scgid13010/ Neurogenic locus notch protein homolog